MVIYNITFVILPSSREKFLDWMRGKAIPALFNAHSAASNPRLQTVAEAGGEKPGEDHGLSIALQAEFPDVEMAHEWHDTVLPAVLGDFTTGFGPHALFFTTLLEVIPL